MAIEVFSEISSAGISPRISFSHDLNQKDDGESIEEHHHQRLDTSLLDSSTSSSSDFDFCFGNSFVQGLSSADELFSNGKILPIEIKKKPVVAKQVHRQSELVNSPPLHTAKDNTGKKRLKEFLSMSIDADDKPASSKSFWQFKRSSSLNCESNRSKSLIRSLQFLSRSNSTGSAPNPKPTTMLSKETQKQHLQKQPSLSRKSSMSSSSAAFYTYSNSTQKTPLKKNCGAYGNGVRVSPVLNLPHPFISNASVSFFGFGSLFCNSKVKKKRR